MKRFSKYLVIGILTLVIMSCALPNQNEGRLQYNCDPNVQNCNNEAIVNWDCDPITNVCNTLSLQEVTPLPTDTPVVIVFPTDTPQPTFTPLATYTPYPTGTPQPTYTPYPTATPTLTPQPTPTVLPFYAQISLGPDFQVYMGPDSVPTWAQIYGPQPVQFVVNTGVTATMLFTATGTYQFEAYWITDGGPYTATMAMRVNDPGLPIWTIFTDELGVVLPTVTPLP